MPLDAIDLQPRRSVLAAALLTALSSLAHAGPACDERLAATLREQPQTTVLLTRAFQAGEPVALPGSPGTAPRAPLGLCLVKLLVGPGAPAAPGSASGSPGIGIEVWLPEAGRWNGVIRAYGNGGWAGGAQGDVHRLGRSGAMDVVQLGALAKGYAISSSDHGHPGNPAIGTNRDASFTFRDDGTLNTELWRDFAERSLHEQALKTKAAVAAYYGRAQTRAYWDGFSTGGRQAYKLAQRYPGDFDGILAGAPAFNWSRFITAELYPQLLMLRELGGPIPAARLDAVSAAANAACGGAALGFQLDPLACRYDPTRDAAVLCAGSTGASGVAGTSTDAQRCVTPAQAAVINRLWYGQTVDGQAPEPAQDNGAAPTLREGRQLWYGLSRGTQLTALAGAVPFPVATTMLAVQLQDPRYAQTDKPYLVNARVSPQDLWKTLDYAGLARAAERGVALQRELSDINTDDASLAGARAAGLKILSYHGLADELIMPQGSLHYFQRAAQQQGGVAALQQFNRLFLVPGLAHDSSFARTGALDPATGALVSADKVPLPQAANGRDELFEALRAWVERGVAPERIEVASRHGAVTLPLCAYPAQPVHDGRGPVTAAASYACR